MTRTQIQLPNALYERAKRIAAEHELSLAEMARRGLELFLDRFPEEGAAPRRWKLPRVDGGGLRVPLSRLRDLAHEEEASRSRSRK
jgi:hypothetical protein